MIKTITQADFNEESPANLEGLDVYYSSCILGPGIVCHVLHDDDDGVVAQPIDHPNLNARLNRGQFIYTTPLHVLAEAAPE